MNKIRHPGQGPYISTANIQEFLTFCNTKGHATRVSPFPSAYDVRYAGHWMGLRYNSGYKRFTADSRLAELVKAYVLQKPQTMQIPVQQDLF